MKLLISIIIPQLAGALGAFFTAPSIAGWYSGINKPSFNPPSWVFGPVWTILYLLMGISLYLVWNQGKGAQLKAALIFFFIQLALNSLWSIIFFGMQRPGLAFVEILILFVFIVLTIMKFFPISKVAAYLLIPYLLWVGFASFLNLAIYRLN